MKGREGRGEEEDLGKSSEARTIFFSLSKKLEGGKRDDAKKKS